MLEILFWAEKCRWVVSAHFGSIFSGSKFIPRKECRTAGGLTISPKCNFLLIPCQFITKLSHNLFQVTKGSFDIPGLWKANCVSTGEIRFDKKSTNLCPGLSEKNTLKIKTWKKLFFQKAITSWKMCLWTSSWSLSVGHEL